MEVWKVAPGFSAYEVSSLGRIRRVREYETKGRRHDLPYILTPNSAGRVKLRSDKYRVVQVSLARLVALAFNPPSRPRLTLRHADGDTHNMRADNLMWTLHPTPRRGKGKVYSKPVYFVIDKPRSEVDNLVHG